MMQAKRWNVLLACLCLSLTVGVSLATTIEEASPAETATETAAIETAATEATCGVADDQTLTAEIIQIEDPKPKGYCNCNVNSDCDSICGEGGGGCLITIPCEEGSRYSGWCHCNNNNPIRVETAEI